MLFTGSTQIGSKLRWRKAKCSFKNYASCTSYDPFHETITYTDFQKVESITDQENNNRLEFTYGPDYGRRMMKTLEGGSLKKTKYYSNGIYEKIVNDLGQTKEINYISGSSGLAAVFIKDFDNTQKMYYVHQDYLGSILALTNENGTVAERYYFDAWGNRKNPNNWSSNETRTSFILDRGFTGHEHLDHFNLINMSRPKGEHEQELRVTFGRVYDASLGSFLSADPVIQAPNYTQDLNLYSYAYGNPLKYTDPSGYTESPTPPPDGEHRRSGVRLHSTMNPGYRINFPDSGPGFQDFNTNINGVWVKNSVLKESGYQTFSVSTLQYYLNAGFDIVFQFNGTASYALAVDNGVTLGSAAGVTWNDNLANYGFVNGYNKGAASGGGEDYSLFFNGETLSVMQGDKTVYSTVANSGKGEHMNNPNSQKVSNLGPIPEGNYFFYNHQWSHQSKLRQVYNIVVGNGDWGDYNVPLNFISWKEPRTLRYGFYLHGGFWPGSAGCIDAGSGVGDVYNYVKNQGVTYLRVQY